MNLHSKGRAALAMIALQLCACIATYQVSLAADRRQSDPFANLPDVGVQLKTLHAQWIDAVAKSGDVKQATGRAVLGAKFNVLVSLFKEILRDDKLKRMYLARLPTVRETEWSYYANQALLVALVDAGARDDVVSVLARRCPDYVYALETELYLVLETTISAAFWFFAMPMTRLAMKSQKRRWQRASGRR